MAKNVMKLTFLYFTDLVLKFKWKIAFPQFHTVCRMKFLILCELVFSIISVYK